MTLTEILWILLVILLVAWLIGFSIGGVGPIINVLLVLALVVLVYNLLASSRRAI